MLCLVLLPQMHHHFYCIVGSYLAGSEPLWGISPLYVIQYTIPISAKWEIPSMQQNLLRLSD